MCSLGEEAVAASSSSSSSPRAPYRLSSTPDANQTNEGWGTLASLSPSLVGLCSRFSHSSLQWAAERARAVQRHDRAVRLLHRSRELVATLGLSPGSEQALVALTLEQHCQIPQRNAWPTTEAAPRARSQVAPSQEGTGSCGQRHQRVTPQASLPQQESASTSPCATENARCMSASRMGKPGEPVLFAVAASGMSSASSGELREVVQAVRPSAVVLVLEPHEHRLLGLLHASSSPWQGPSPPLRSVQCTGLSPNSASSVQGEMSTHPMAPASRSHPAGDSAPADLSATYTDKEHLPRGWTGIPASCLNPGPVPDSPAAVIAYAASQRIASPALFHVWAALHFLRSLMGAHPLSHLAVAASEAHALGATVVAVPCTVPSSLYREAHGSSCSAQSESGSQSLALRRGSSACQLACPPSCSQGCSVHRLCYPSPGPAKFVEAQRLSHWDTEGDCGSDTQPMAQEIARQYMALFEVPREGNGDCAAAEEEAGAASSLVPASASQQALDVLRKACRGGPGQEEGSTPANHNSFALAAAAYRQAAERCRQQELAMLKEGWVQRMGIGERLLGLLCSLTGGDSGLPSAQGLPHGGHRDHDKLTAGAGCADTGQEDGQGVLCLVSGLQELAVEAALRVSLEGQGGAGGASPDRGSPVTSISEDGLVGCEAHLLREEGPVLAVMSAGFLRQVSQAWCQHETAPSLRESSVQHLLAASLLLMPGEKVADNRCGRTLQGGVEEEPLRGSMNSRVWIWNAAFNPLGWVQGARGSPLGGLLPHSPSAPGLALAMQLGPDQEPAPRAVLHQKLPSLLDEGALVVASGAVVMLALGGKAASWASAGWLLKVGGFKAASSARLGLLALRSWPQALWVAKAFSFTGASSSATASAIVSAGKVTSLGHAKGAAAYAFSMGSKAGGASFIKGSGAMLSSSAAVPSGPAAVSATAAGTVSSSGASSAAAAGLVGAGAPKSSAASAAVFGGWARQTAQQRVQQIMWRMVATFLDQRLRLACMQNLRSSPTASNCFFSGPWNFTQQQGKPTSRGSIVLLGLAGAGAGSAWLCSAVEKASPRHPVLGPAHCALRALPASKEVASLGRGIRSLEIHL